MELTELHKEIAGNAALLAPEGRGIVLEDYALGAAAELEAASWLERRTEPNGDTSWWWTGAAETALALGSMTADVEQRMN
jgi:hypothetical protein